MYTRITAAHWRSIAIGLTGLGVVAAVACRDATAPDRSRLVRADYGCELMQARQVYHALRLVPAASINVKGVRVAASNYAPTSIEPWNTSGFWGGDCVVDGSAGAWNSDGVSVTQSAGDPYACPTDYCQAVWQPDNFLLTIAYANLLAHTDLGNGQCSQLADAFYERVQSGHIYFFDTEGPAGAAVGLLGVTSYVQGVPYESGSNIYFYTGYSETDPIQAFALTALHEMAHYAFNDRDNNSWNPAENAAQSCYIS